MKCDAYPFCWLSCLQDNDYYGLVSAKEMTMNAVFDANAEFATYATDQMAAYPQSLAAPKLHAFSASTRNFQCLANATLVAVLAQADGAAVQQSWPTDPATVLELYSDMLVGEMCKHLDFREEQLKQVRLCAVAAWWLCLVCN